LEELVQAGAHTFIRVGTSGAMQESIDAETLGVIHAAIRDEGTSLHYLPVEFPAVADPEVTAALTRAARMSGLPFRVGVAQSKDSYYGQHDPGRMPVEARLRERWTAWARGGAICSEMEVAALYTVAAVLRVRAGAIVTIHPLAQGRPAQADAPPPLDALVDAAVAAMSDLIEKDRDPVVTPGPAPS
jgi:uridine phosphorylase